MKARIYRPARTAMQSGKAKTHTWRLEFQPVAAPYTDPLMGWTGMRDTTQELNLSFDSAEEAIAYAKKNGIEHNDPFDSEGENDSSESGESASSGTQKITPKSYAANFAFNRVE